MMTQPKTKEEIEAMREGGRMLATILEATIKQVKPGMSTKDLADFAAKELNRLGTKPAFLGYHGFPDVLCTSVNEEVVHGIPSEHKIIEEGDIVSLDFGVLHKGLITDAARSTIAGKPASGRDKELVEATKRSLDAAIDTVVDGVKLGTIGAAAQNVLEKAKFGIVRDFVGHGVGHQLHEEPNIPNYGVANQGPMLHAGMTVAIEPMATIGDYEVQIQQDGWTVVTVDGSRSAHFEDTILVTEDGAEILTRL
jgi:methionyl aminopeptidase